MDSTYATGKHRSNPYIHARAKLTLVSIDQHKLRVEAQYNPKELTLTQPVKWNEVNAAAGHNLSVEFGAVGATTLSLELLFDGFEAGESVQPRIDTLKKLAAPRVPGATKSELSRPHACLVVWGARGMPRLSCVIESVATKYLMMDTDGRPLRASCTVALKETHGFGPKDKHTDINQNFDWYDREGR